ncbi:hypothetical protein [uncultured Sphaerochaeta sp.]|uniref:hypothetical protein n=1 Tax=uncultured Sphaerochaeta sp. TaxID=886478 RepID=UPI002A0A733C|nr:hypothetical protein [uncultured Sphaerochaeta sp.]
MIQKKSTFGSWLFFLVANAAICVAVTANYLYKGIMEAENPSVFLSGFICMIIGASVVAWYILQKKLPYSVLANVLYIVMPFINVFRVSLFDIELPLNMIAFYILFVFIIIPITRELKQSKKLPIDTKDQEVQQ